MTAAHEPRDVPEPERLWRVDIARTADAAYGWGATLDEARDHAWWYFKRQLSRRTSEARRLIVQQKVDGFWRIVSRQERRGQRWVEVES